MTKTGCKFSISLHHSYLTICSIDAVCGRFSFLLEILIATAEVLWLLLASCCKLSVVIAAATLLWLSIPIIYLVNNASLLAADRQPYKLLLAIVLWYDRIGNLIVLAFWVGFSIPIVCTLSKEPCLYFSISLLADGCYCLIQLIADWYICCKVHELYNIKQIIFNSGFESRFLKDMRVYTVSIL